jgi:hypothetical protein
MKTKKKLKLEDIRIESFVTCLDDSDKNNVNGGFIVSPWWICTYSDNTDSLEPCD